MAVLLEDIQYEPIIVAKDIHLIDTDEDGFTDNDEIFSTTDWNEAERPAEEIKMTTLDDYEAHIGQIQINS